MRKLLGLVAAALFCAGGGQVRAESNEKRWHEVKTRHFIIYSDDSPKNLREFATRIEKFDSAARVLLKMDDPPLGDGNRLTIFVLPNEAEVRKIAGEKGGTLQGFYTGRATGSLAYVPRRTEWEGMGGSSAESVLFHEYAHHLMMQQLSQPYPQWYVEGFAEFLTVPKFERDGSIGLGTPPAHRTWGLMRGRSLSLEALLGASYTNLDEEQRESIYGRGWLLVHYLVMEPKRRGQFGSYITSIAKGVQPLDAARSAFGDLKRLDRELTSYLRRRSIEYFKVNLPQFDAGSIEVKPLSRGAAEVILLRARLKNGVNEKELPSLAAQLRQLQASYPGEELVELTLAEAELLLDRYTAAEAAADRAARVNPRSTEALVFKGRALLGQASEFDGDATGLFEEARKHFIAANRIDSEDPEPLMEFYSSYLYQGLKPTANAIEALHYASDLAPQDLNLRINSAMAYLSDSKSDEARRTLIPVAYSPHGGGIAQAAQAMIAKIDSGDPEGALSPYMTSTE